MIRLLAPLLPVASRGATRPRASTTAATLVAAALAPLALAAATLSCVHPMPSTGAAAKPPSVVFVARRVYTLEPRRPAVEALVMRGGMLTFAGSERDALAFAGPGAAVERWPGATIVPGLVDAHGHLASLGRALAVVSLDGTRSEGDAVERLGTAPATARQGAWLLGRGWDQNDWNLARFPSRASLDARFPTTPVLLTRVDGHAVWVNSAALARAGIGAATADPPGGRILRDERGEPTGVLVDNAVDLVTAAVPPPSPEERRRRLKLALEACARVGLTGVHDAGTALEDLRILQEWDMLGALPLRVYAMADGQGADAEVYLGLGRIGGRRLEVRAVKLLADGALGSRGAALRAPYSDEPSQAGLMLLSPEQLRARAQDFAARGFQVAIHAIGDRANGVVLDVLAGLERERPGARHRVEHAQVLAPEDVPRFAAAGVIASMQPTHATSDMPWAEARLGPERLAGAYAWRSLLDAGARLAFGSDFPIESPNPLAGLFAARTRQDAHGQPPGGWRPEQRLSGEVALAGFTTGAAYAAFAEERRGRLAPGLDADFVVLDVDPVEGPPEALLGGRVLVTVVDGIDVYRAAP